MGMLGLGVLQSLYKEFSGVSLTYNQSVIRALGLQMDHVTITIQGRIFPCVIHSSSFVEGKVLVRIPETAFSTMDESQGRTGHLHLPFFNKELSSIETFSISGHFSVIQSQKAGTGDLALLLALVYNHRPQDGFLEIQGSYLSLMKDTHQRAQERLAVSDSNFGQLGLTSPKALISIDKIDLDCIITELSFGGARILLPGLAASPLKCPCDLTMTMIKNGATTLPGNIIRSEPVPGRSDLALLGILYISEQVNMEYLKSFQKALKLFKSQGR